MKHKALSLLLFASSPLMAADVTVTGDITANTTWTADNTYIMDKPIFVTNGAVLTIEPGTLILGDENTGNSTFGSLVVTRGSQLVAEGTAAAPIVFTAREERDGIDGNPAVKPDPALGDASYWGGIVLLGNAQVNNYVGGVNTGEARIEGFPVEANTTNTTYGGGLNPNNTDSSGVLKYVSIRFGGYEFAANNEINGLTLGGVGSGTTIQFVEVVSNSDDGVEFFGGTVNTKNIAVAFCHDESFDIDQGHSGFHQFWFAIQNANPSLGDFGGEWDGGFGSTVTEGPETLVTIYNMTLLGTGSTAVGSIDDGINLSDAFAGTLANSVIHDFNGVALSNVGDGVQLPKPVFNNNTWGVFAGGAGIVPNIGGANATDPAGSNNSVVGTDPQFRGISRIADGGLDPRPSSSSSLLTDSLAALPVGAPAGFFEQVNYRGAFGESNWLRGWSYLDQKGYLASSDSLVVDDITTNTTWTADNTYILDKPIFVTNGSVLTIEPGTLILGDENTGNSTFGSLVVTRGSKLVAEGTAEAPIVFTAREERDGIDGNPAVKPDPALGDASYWGGIVLLGNAQVNNYVGGVNTGEARIEGFPVEANTTNTTYGGGLVPNNADNSGVLKYVSIRFGGFEFAANSEINGLTLGGVGSGTTIEFVEVVSNSDDGVEFFGGTVNTKNIAVAFCHDESFDIDQGHSGFHQFWFAIQNANPSLGDFGGEWDGGHGSTVTEGPESLVTIYNMTLLGTGSTAVGSIDDGINLSDAFAGTLANSVIHDFNGVALSNVGDGVQLPKPVFNNNTWGVFAGGAGIVPNIGGANAVDPAGSNNSAVGTDPQLRGISRITDGGLDPRPSNGSTLLTSSLAALPSGAPVGFYDQVNYRGAFGETNWLSGWSYLDKAGYLSEIPDVPVVDATAPVITLIGANPLNVLFGGTFTDPGASVSDNVDATRTITGTGTVNTNQAGSYVITYNAVDAAQNSAVTVTRSVIVSEPVPVIPTSELFVTSPGSKADIANYFVNEPFTNAVVAVVGKLPSGLKFNASTKVITGYPSKLPAQATFSVTVLGEPAADFVMGFAAQAVTTEVLGTHIVQTPAGDNLTIVITNKASASVSILKPGVTKAISAKGLVVFDSEASDPSQEWTLNIPAQNLAIAFPVTRELKVEDGSYLGDYGLYDGKSLRGFKSSDSTGTIVLNKAATNVQITGILGSKGSVSWTVTPVGGKAIKVKGSVSADGICSLYANVPVAGVMAGMVRVDEELDVNDVPTGQLTVSLLQGFEGWTPVSYTAP
jgi:hypothetical protein